MAEGETKTPIVELREAVATQIASCGGTLFDQMASEMARDTISKRKDALIAAHRARDALRASLNKTKADVQPTLDDQGKAIGTATWSAKQWKAKEELTAKLKKIEDAINAAWTLQLDKDSDPAKTSEAFQKLTQTTQQVGKVAEAKGGDDDAA